MASSLQIRFYFAQHQNILYVIRFGIVGLGYLSITMLDYAYMACLEKVDVIYIVRSSESVHFLPYYCSYSIYTGDARDPVRALSDVQALYIMGIRPP